MSPRRNSPLLIAWLATQGHWYAWAVPQTGLGPNHTLWVVPGNVRGVAYRVLDHRSVGGALAIGAVVPPVAALDDPALIVIRYAPPCMSQADLAGLVRQRGFEMAFGEPVAIEAIVDPDACARRRDRALRSEARRISRRAREGGVRLARGEALRVACERAEKVEKT